jgi:hypothetical protein
MKIKVHLAPHLDGVSATDNEYEGDLILMSIDQQGNLTLVVQDVNGHQLNGAVFAHGSWVFAEQVEGPRADIIAAARARQEETRRPVSSYPRAR